MEDLIIRPELQLQGLATGDLLSQVLAQIRLTGDRVYSARLGAKGRLTLEARAAHVCILRDGCLRIACRGDAATTIRPGDLFLLTRDSESPRVVAIDGPATMIVCRFWFDASSLRAMQRVASDSFQRDARETWRARRRGWHRDRLRVGGRVQSSVQSLLRPLAARGR